METDEKRAEIIANGLVQGVGFRYFVIRNAESLKLKGYTKNLYTGEVVTVVEGSRVNIEELFKRIRVGPTHASVHNCTISWEDSKNEFTNFEVRY